MASLGSLIPLQPREIRIYNEWLANLDFRSSIPSPETCEILLDAYFRTSESAFRIFHIPTFKKEYDQYRHQPLLTSDSFILKMLLAMAIRVTSYQEPDAEILRTQAKKWVYAAQSWLSEIPYEKSRPNIAGLQVYCLSLIARQSLVLVDDLAGYRLVASYDKPSPWVCTEIQNISQI
jgi:hypothetical protein